MNSVFQTVYLSPRYWGAWLSIAGLRAGQALPTSLRWALGRRLGDLLRQLLPARRRVVERNLKLCFPRLTAEQRAHWLRDVFRENGIGVLETARCWCRPPAQLIAQTRYSGLEHIEQALAQGRGVLVLGSHFSLLDPGIAMLGKVAPVHLVYRPHNNPLMDAWINAGRLNYARETVDHNDMRRVVRLLKEGQLVWFGPDQDEGPTHSVYAPFFGISAATVTSTARLSRLTGAAVVPMASHRCEDGGYEVEFYPALSDFPSGLAEADARQVNLAQEQAIRKCPQQYLWLHRRFKTHPRGKNYRYQ